MPVLVAEVPLSTTGFEISIDQPSSPNTPVSTIVGSFLALGVIVWLKEKWIEVKIQNTMKDVDRQTDQIIKEWEENEPRKEPTIVETGVFGNEGWSIEITNPIVERGSDSISTGMVPPSDVQRLQEDEGDKGTS
jgi:hypothetical protein